MRIHHLAPLLMFLSAQSVVADTPAVSVKQIGALFLEAPPGRDKNLVPFGVFGTGEKVEAHAVVSFENRLIADIPTFGDDSKVSAIAILPNKTHIPLGTATSSSFRKVSDNGKMTVVSLSVSRLPDSAVMGVVFSGTIKLPVAKSVVRKSAPFDPKVGSRVEAGLGTVTISKIESASFTFSGDDRLTQVAAIRIMKPDGTALVGTRGSYLRQGSVEGISVSSQWQFSGPISPGRIEISTYAGFEIVEVPVNLMVTKPY